MWGGGGEVNISGSGLGFIGSGFVSGLLKATDKPNLGP